MFNVAFGELSINKTSVRCGRGNRRITIREAANDVGVSFGSCKAILLCYGHDVEAKRAPNFLNFDQYQCRMTCVTCIGQVLLNEVNDNSKHLKRVITCNKTLV